MRHIFKSLLIDDIVQHDKQIVRQQQMLDQQKIEQTQIQQKKQNNEISQADCQVVEQHCNKLQAQEKKIKIKIKGEQKKQQTLIKLKDKNSQSIFKENQKKALDSQEVLHPQEKCQQPKSDAKKFSTTKIKDQNDASELVSQDDAKNQRKKWKGYLI